MDRLEELLNMALQAYAGDPTLMPSQREGLLAGALHKVTEGAYDAAADILYAEKRAGVLLALGRRLLCQSQLEPAFTFLKYVVAIDNMFTVATGALRQGDLYLAGQAQLYAEALHEHRETYDRLITSGQKADTLIEGATQAAYTRWIMPPLPMPEGITSEEQQMVDQCLPE